MNDKNLQTLLDGVFQPDLVKTIENYSSLDDNRKYQYILAELCNRVKTFITKKVYKPYIHLKDDHGNFVYNDWLHIKTKTDRIKDFYSSFQEHQTDIIYDGKDEYSAYYLVSYQTSKGPLTSIGKVRFENTFYDFNPLELLALINKPLTESIEYLIENGEVFPEEFSVDPNLLIHIYDKTKNAWTIESPLDQIKVTIDPTDS